MPIPARTKTWSITPNHLLAATGSAAGNTRQFWRWLKNHLVSVGWALKGSSDGAAGALDTTDRWVDDADVVLATSNGSAHGWVVLEHPTLGVQILLSGVTSSTGNGRAGKVVFSPAAGFTDGSETTDPTATDEVQLIDGTSDEPWGGGPITGTNASANWDYIVHAWHSDDDDVDIISLTRGGVCQMLVYLGKPENPPEAWEAPFVAAWYAALDGTPANLQAEHLFHTLTGNVGVERCYGLAMPPSAGNLELHLCGPAVSVGNSASTVALIGDSNAAFTASVNQSTGESAAPRVGLYCVASGSHGEHGRLFDVRWSGEEGATGDVFTDAASGRWVKMGGWLLPWDDSVPVVA